MCLRIQYYPFTSKIGTCKINVEMHCSGWLWVSLSDLASVKARRWFWVANIIAHSYTNFVLWFVTGQYGWRCLVCPSDDQKWYVLEIKRGRPRIECQPEPGLAYFTSPCHDQSFRTSCEIKCQISRRLNISFTRERKLCKALLQKKNNYNDAL